MLLLDQSFYGAVLSRNTLTSNPNTKIIILGYVDEMDADLRT